MPLLTPSVPDWIDAAANSVSALAVVIGLIFAYRQLASWREQERQKSRALTAETIILNALSIKDVLVQARHPLSSIPQGQLSNKYYDLDRRSKVLQDNASYFAALRLAQFKAQLLNFGKETDDAVLEIFRVRNDFFDALHLLADYVDQKPSTQEERDLIMDAKNMAYGHGGSKDLLAKRINDSVLILEARLGPMIRLNE